MIRPSPPFSALDLSETETTLTDDALPAKPPRSQRWLEPRHRGRPAVQRPCYRESLNAYVFNPIMVLYRLKAPTERERSPAD